MDEPDVPTPPRRDEEATSRAPWHAKSVNRDIHFFVVLRDPLGIPADFTFERQTPHPVGKLEDHPAYNGDYPGHSPIHASIKYRFHKFGQATIATQQIDALLETANRRAVELGWSREASEDFDLETMSDGATTESSWTIVEMIFHDPGIGEFLYEFQQSHEYPDWLSQCMVGLREIVRAFRIVSKAPVAEATYQSLIPLVLTLEVANDGTLLSDLSYSILNSMGNMWVEGSLNDSNRTRAELYDDLQQVAGRLSENDPFMGYNDRIWRAERLLRVEGQFNLAILEAAIATEGLLYSTWLALQWEKDEDPVAAYSKLYSMTKSRPTKTILSWLGAELGGRWEPENCPAARDWVERLQRWRNEIAHANSRFEEADAWSSLEISRKMSQFLVDRLVVRFDKFPRTTYLTGGTNRLSQKNRREFDERFGNEPPLFVSLASWMRDGRAGSQ